MAESVNDRVFGHLGVEGDHEIVFDRYTSGISAPLDLLGLVSHRDGR